MSTDRVMSRSKLFTLLLYESNSFAEMLAIELDFFTIYFYPSLTSTVLLSCLNFIVSDISLLCDLMT